MSPWQALLFFFREALVGLRRSWKVSLLAVVTIAVSLFIGGAVLLLSGNLTRVIEGWRAEARVVIYLEQASEPAALSAVRVAAAEPGWIRAVEEVSGELAEERFRAAFPGLGGLLSGWEGEPLPTSLEVSYDPQRVEEGVVRDWVLSLRELPGVAMVDDDREWLRQLERLIGVVRGLGLTLGGTLLVAAVFTISSVIRLTAFLYRDEIAVLRLVGATEFVIRGPFLAEGLLQGLAGGVLAVGSLFLAFELSGAEGLPALFGSVLFDRFLSPPALVALVGLGGLAGLFGAVLSMRHEQPSV